MEWSIHCCKNYIVTHIQLFKASVDYPESNMLSVKILIFYFYLTSVASGVIISFFEILIFLFPFLLLSFLLLLYLPVLFLYFYVYQLTFVCGYDWTGSQQGSHLRLPGLLQIRRGHRHQLPWPHQLLWPPVPGPTGLWYPLSYWFFLALTGLILFIV